MARVKELSATGVAAKKAPGRYRAGPGLYLQISKWRTKSWLFRYQLAGRSREMGLGPYPAVSLLEARKKARAAQSMLVDGDDPIETRKIKKQALAAESAKRITFKQATEQYIKAHTHGWRNAKHAIQWGSTLSTYAFPIIGNLAVGDIETGHIAKIVEPIWATKTETASRIRGRIESILDWSKTRGYRKGENPARWKGHMENLLPAKSKVRQVRHQPAMPYCEVPEFVAELKERDGVSSLALEFTILTAARTSEAIKAKWDEIDLISAIWTVPADRTKAGREHRVPLSERVTAILRALPREKNSAYVFPGDRPRQPLSNMAMLELLRGMRSGEVTVHGFRSSFRDWAAEATNYPGELAEAALGHAVGDKVEAAYRRGDALEKRRKLMEAWSRHCATPKVKGANVTALRTVR